MNFFFMQNQVVKACYVFHRKIRAKRQKCYQTGKTNVTKSAMAAFLEFSLFAAVNHFPCVVKKDANI